MVLADFVRLPKAAQVADLGSGGGVLGLLLCGRYSDCTVTGVELCQQAHQAALENIDRNGLGRLRSVLGDLRQVRTILPATGPITGSMARRAICMPKMWICLLAVLPAPMPMP